MELRGLEGFYLGLAAKLWGPCCDRLNGTYCIAKLGLGFRV